MPKNNLRLDVKLFAGAATFGFGWGLAGLCPGPGMIDFFTMSHCIIWVPCLAIGQVGTDLTTKLIGKIFKKNVKACDECEPKPDGSLQQQSKVDPHP